MFAITGTSGARSFTWKSRNASRSESRMEMEPSPSGMRVSWAARASSRFARAPTTVPGHARDEERQRDTVPQEFGGGVDFRQLSSLTPDG
jgi:hypothetical protein